VIPKLGRFSDRFIDHRVQRNDLSDKFASDRLRVRRWIDRGQSGAETDGNFGRQICKKARQPTQSSAEIGTSKNNAGRAPANYYPAVAKILLASAFDPTPRCQR
jgi:hypothetical protein